MSEPDFLKSLSIDEQGQFLDQKKLADQRIALRMEYLQQKINDEKIIA
jgi:hypothetical protein